ncbi:MAG: hypothetical protein ACOYK9_00735 [Chlamydiia bacterium]
MAPRAIPLKNIILLIIIPLVLVGRGKDTDISSTDDIPVEFQTPWLTGPLLTPSARTIPKGHINIQPYAFFTSIYGEFNDRWQIDGSNHSFNTSFETFLNYGLTSWLDTAVLGQVFVNSQNGKTYTGIGDTLFGFGFQLSHEDPKGYRPAIKLIIAETFPTGNYSDLDPFQLGADALGNGSYTTRVGLVFGKTYYIKDYIWVNTRSLIGYNYHTPVHVKNFNSYGGGFNTNGTIHRGGFFPINIGLEVSLSKNLTIACDVISLLSGPVTFKGISGTDSLGQALAIGSPVAYQLSIAPALEWNFSANFGIIGGTWFTIAGKNANAFASGVISINIYQ